MNSPLFGLVLYLVVIAAVGVATWGRNRTKEDFILGGRRLGGWVIAFSERTAAESSWLILGLSGAFFATGLVEVWTALGCCAGIVASWWVVARPLRELSGAQQSLTLPEVFAQASGPFAREVRVVAMLIIVFFFAFYIAAQFIGAGKVLKVTFGLEPALGMPLAAAVVVAYTLMGGFLAVCYTDVVQAVLMVVTLVVLPVVGLVLVAQQGLDVAGALAAKGHAASVLGGKTGWPAVAAVVGGLSWGLHNIGQPHLVTKFMALRSAAAVTASRRVAMIWTALAYGGATLVGIVGIALVHGGLVGAGDAAAVAADQERILPVLAGLLFPAWLAGILIAGAIAAMMSTADSQLLVATSTLVEDYWCRARGRELRPAKSVRAGRLVTLGVGLAAYALAATSDDLIYDVVSMAWAGLGSSFGPALLLVLHWRGMNGAGVLAGMVTGAVSTVAWVSVPGLDDQVSVRFAAWVLAIGACVLGARFGRSGGRDRFAPAG
ncbi:MAG TPA: sodium/proline symporter [Candidatus Krumholzibacteria bacterium]|nr:sodium/proline symporter [Candidatus Krumholzibacteria bacterium]HPD72254.1 sodium/proline symporter [Candidatus Krumholzibacteria bacterium]HRY40814.1 sodium/proline symporter [Candidatus Krumholzibacteria bacterium]